MRETLLLRSLAPFRPSGPPEPWRRGTREEEGSGGEGTRTPDPDIANVVLYQLSYTPTDARIGPHRSLIVYIQSPPRRKAENEAALTMATGKEDKRNTSHRFHRLTQMARFATETKGRAFQPCPNLSHL